MHGGKALALPVGALTIAMLANFEKYYMPPWYYGLALTSLSVWLVSRTVLLWMGARYVAKLTVGLGRCFLAIVLAGLGSLLLATASCVATLLVGQVSVLLGPVAFLGWLAILPVGWWIIQLILRSTYGQAILAWLPTLASWVIAIPLLVTFVLPSVALSRDRARLASCLATLEAMGEGFTRYRADHNGQFPPSLDAFVAAGNDPNLLECPCSPIQGPSYFYLAPPAECDPRCIVACDYYCNHADHRCVLFRDGTVKSMNAEQFSQELATPANARFATALAAAEGSQRTTRAAQKNP